MAASLVAPPLAAMALAVSHPGAELGPGPRPLRAAGAGGGGPGPVIFPATVREDEATGGRRAVPAARPWGRAIVLLAIGMALGLRIAPRALEGPALGGRQTARTPSSDPQKNIVPERPPLWGAAIACLSSAKHTRG